MSDPRHRLASVALLVALFAAPPRAALQDVAGPSAEPVRAEIAGLQQQIEIVARELRVTDLLVTAQQDRARRMEALVSEAAAAAEEMNARFAALSTALSEIVAAVDSLDARLAGRPVPTPPAVRAELEGREARRSAATGRRRATASGGLDLGGFVCGGRVDLSSFPRYRIPSESECDWVIEGSSARSSRGLADVQADKNGDIAGKLYRASRAAGQRSKIVIGVRGWGGSATAGGKWGGRNAVSVCDTTFQDDIEVAFVGLDDDARMALGWSNQNGYVKRLEAFNLAIQGQRDSFVMRCTDKAGTIIFDGCTLLGAEGMMHDSGRHLGNFETLVIRNEAYSGTLFREHWGYFKSVRGGGIWLIDNDMRGGNRTCFQIRPGAEESQYEMPRGQVVALGNRADGYGFTHGSDPSTRAGGAAISIWSAPNDPVFVLGNRITNSRYGCLMISAQPAVEVPGRGAVDRNWYGARGYPIDTVFVEGNTFGNERGDRATAQISGAAEVHVYDNEFVAGSSGLVLDDPWSMQRAAPSRPMAKRNGVVRFHSGLPGGVSIQTSVRDGQGWKLRDLTSEEKSALVADPPPAADAPDRQE